MPYIRDNNDNICLSRRFVLDKLQTANATYVKIYIYMLALSGGSAEYGEIADRLGVLESDVINAVKYWTSEGAMFEKDGSVSFSPIADEIFLPVSEKDITTQKSDYNKEQISDAVIASPALRDMIAVAEELLQKPINQSEMETLYWFYDGLGFSPEAVLMLLEYCVDKRKHVFPMPKRLLFHGVTEVLKHLRI